MHDTGADPGIFVRGGPTFRNFWQAKKKKKKKKKKKEEGRKRKKWRVVVCGVSFVSTDVWFESTFQTINYIQVYFR